MPERYHSPDDVADLLGLHVRTVRRHIREGRLPATRIGNRYRIAPPDLEAFAGGPVTPPPPGRPPVDAEVTAVVELSSVTRADADRLTTLLTAAAGSREDRSRLRVDVAHDPDRQRVKVVVIGTIAHTQAVLGLVAAFQEG